MKDEELIAQAKTGSERAFTKLYDIYYKTINRNIFFIVKNQDVADDLSSETFLKAFKGIHKFTQNISFEMWLKTIANHHSIDFIRSNKKSQDNVYIDDELSAEFIHSDYSNPEKDLIQKESEVRLDEEMNKLTSRAKQVLDSRYKDGLTYQEIADKFGISIGTVKHYIFKYKNKIIENINNPKKKSYEKSKSIVLSGNKILS